MSIGELVMAKGGLESLPLGNELHERFCWIFTYGTEALGLEVDPPVTPGNAGAAYSVLKPRSKPGTQRSQACRLLRRDEVLSRIKELRQTRDSQIKALAPSFVEFYSDAIRTVDMVRRGTWRPEDMAGLDPRTIPQLERNALLAAQEFINRTLGSVTHQHKVDTRTQSAIIVRLLAGGAAGLEQDEPLRAIELKSVTDP